MRPLDATPVGAASGFIESLDRSDDPAHRRQAFRLLCPEAQVALGESARLAASLGGRTFEGWEMLAEGRSRLIQPIDPDSLEELAAESDPSQRRVRMRTRSGDSRELLVRRVETSWCVDLDLAGPHDSP